MLAIVIIVGGQFETFLLSCQKSHCSVSKKRTRERNATRFVVHSSTFNYSFFLISFSLFLSMILLLITSKKIAIIRSVVLYENNSFSWLFIISITAHRSRTFIRSIFHFPLLLSFQHLLRPIHRKVIVIVPLRRYLSSSLAQDDRSFFRRPLEKRGNRDSSFFYSSIGSRSW